MHVHGKFILVIWHADAIILGKLHFRTDWGREYEKVDQFLAMIKVMNKKLPIGYSALQYVFSNRGSTYIVSRYCTRNLCGRCTAPISNTGCYSGDETIQL